MGIEASDQKKDGEVCRIRLLILGAMPPPYSGYETVTQVLMNSGLEKYFSVKLVDTRTTKETSERGKMSLRNMFSTFVMVVKVVFSVLGFKPQIASVPLAQNRTGFLKLLALAVACKLSRCKIVYRMGGSAFDHFYKSRNSIEAYLVRLGLSLANVITVEGESLKQQFDGLVAKEKLKVLPNGFDIRTWKNTLPIRERLPEKVRVLYLAHISKAKGIFDYLDAIGILADQGKEEQFEFFVAGSVIEKELNILHIDSPSSTSEAIRNVMDNLKIDRNTIKFVGKVSEEEKRELYSIADIVVLPSYSEGYPYTLLEAFASGCSVICTPVGAIGDYLIHKHHVYLVPINSPADIAEGLSHLRDEKFRKKLIDNASIYLQKNHSLPVFSANILEVFESALVGK